MMQLKNLFGGWRSGGLPFEEWQVLSERERLCAQIDFIAARALLLSQMPYDQSRGMPANVHGTARQLVKQTRRAWEALVQEDADEAISAGMEIGIAVESVKAHLAMAKAIDVSAELAQAKDQWESETIAPKRRGGRTRAEQLQAERDARAATAREKWDRLADHHYAEHERAGIIAAQMGVSSRTVRRWLAE